MIIVKNSSHRVLTPEPVLCLLLQIRADLIVRVAVLHLIPGLQETARPLEQPQRYAVESKHSFPEPNAAVNQARYSSRDCH